MDFLPSLLLLFHLVAFSFGSSFASTLPETPAIDNPNDGFTLVQSPAEKRKQKRNKQETNGGRSSKEKSYASVAASVKTSDTSRRQTAQSVQTAVVPKNCKIEHTVFCARTAYDNLILIIFSKKPFLTDFIGIFKAIKKDAHVAKNFMEIQRERGHVLTFAVERQRVDIVQFLLTQVDPMETFNGKRIWDAPIVKAKMLRLFLADDRVPLVEILKNIMNVDNRSELIPVFVFHPRVVCSVGPEILGNPWMQMNWLHYAIIMKYYDLIDYLIQNDVYDVNLPFMLVSLPFPITLAIRTGDTRVVKSVLAAPKLNLLMPLGLHKDALDYAQFYADVKNAPAVDFLNNPVSHTALHQCLQLVREAYNKQLKLKIESGSRKSSSRL